MCLRSTALRIIATSLLLLLPVAVQARVWNSSPQAQAEDYLQIMDVNGKGHIRAIIWLASPLSPNAEFRKLVDQYVMIDVADATMQVDGTTSFTPTTVRAWDANKTELVQLQGDDIPPTIRGVITAMQAIFGQTLGALGRNMQLSIFKAGSVNACEKGQLSVQVNGDTYTYDTPVPGCAQTSASATTSTPADMPDASVPPAAQAAGAPPPSLSGGSVEQVPTRVVGSGGRITLWEGSVLNPDCSSVGDLTVRVTERPKHGALDVAATKVFSHFPPTNPLSVCNSRPERGERLSFTAQTDYVGDDQVEFEAIDPRGNTHDVSVPITIQSCDSCLTPPTPSAPSGNP